MMTRRWIHNDTACLFSENADQGFEIEIIDAKEHDEEIAKLKAEITKLKASK